MTINKKATSPLDIMLQNADRIPSVQKSSIYQKEKAQDSLPSYINEIKESIKDNLADKVLEIDTKDIKIWDLKDDREETERSKRKLEELIDRIKTNGQVVPCIVINSNTPQFKYELIVGRRRFLAAQSLGIKLKAILRSVKNEDEALIIQNEEHEREERTDYERGKFYNRLLTNGKFGSQSELARFYRKDRQEISKVLTFFKIPKQLHDAIDDFDKVTCNTAATIVSIAAKSDDHFHALISLADSIRNGKGHSAIRKMVENIISNISGKRENFTPKKVVDSGRHLFTWKIDQNNNISISFPVNISDLLPQNEIENTLKEVLNTKLNHLTLSSGGHLENEDRKMN